MTGAEFVEVGAEIPALAAWINQPAALAVWKRFWDSTQPVAHPVGPDLWGIPRRRCKSRGWIDHGRN